MKFDVFVIPFTAGLLFLLGYLGYIYIGWVRSMEPSDMAKLKKGLFSLKTFSALKEIFLESLLHRKIFKLNPRLGFMHMSFAFGWFLLIVLGNLELRLYSHIPLNPPYVPIFSKFFERIPRQYTLEPFIGFLMDFILLVILIGVVMAVSKRFYSGFFGMKKTTQLRAGDKFALYSLWLIFPLRLLAESFTSGVFHSGDFLTGTLGNVFASFLPVDHLFYPAYFLYSLTLGVFFVALPFSRYMHIPTEIVLIFFRNYGIVPSKKLDAYSQADIKSCSRCGICIDKCQLAVNAEICNVQSVYFIRSLRHNEVDTKVMNNCLVCGRCKEFCPVGIDTDALRLNARAEKQIVSTFNYSYIKPTLVERADVAFFAGCMTHLTPTIKKAMKNIFEAAAVNYTFLDEHTSICCGRPLMLAGRREEAKELIRKNIAIIEASGAKTLVTSCPICYRVFTEEYKLNIEVLHHTQYILRLVNEGLIKMEQSSISVTYHDPCELGRGSGVYDEPRELLSKTMNLRPALYEKSNSLCCGGSLANTSISSTKRELIAEASLQNLTYNNPDIIATACPLCKKTYTAISDVPIKDIAEIVADGISQCKRAKVAVEEVSAEAVVG
jgi:Fe-S oxidoreductase